MTFEHVFCSEPAAFSSTYWYIVPLYDPVLYRPEMPLFESKWKLPDFEMV